MMMPGDIVTGQAPMIVFGQELVCLVQRNRLVVPDVLGRAARSRDGRKPYYLFTNTVFSR